MKRILILTTALSTGGITSFTIPLANLLAQEYDVTLAYTVDECDKLKCFSKTIKTVSFQIPDKKKTALYMLARGWGHHILKLKLRDHHQVSPTESIQRVGYTSAAITRLPDELLKDYDVAISTAEFYCNDLLAGKIKAKRKVGWIHPDYRALCLDVAFDRKTLDKLDIIVTVSQSTRQSMLEIIPEYEGKVMYLPNLLDVQRIRQMSEQYPSEYAKYTDRKRIVTVCRMDNSSKRLDRVVRIAKMLADRGENFHWFLIGDGKDFDLIHGMIAEYGLSDFVSMVGRRENPYPYIRYADLFVLTSQYEGKPIAVDEAIALHCPVIVSDYCSAREQVRPGCGTVIGNADHTIEAEFSDALDWNTVRKQKEYLEGYLEGYDVQSETLKEFKSKIPFVLSE